MLEIKIEATIFGAIECTDGAGKGDAKKKSKG